LINVCWATAANPVALANVTLLNQTYSSYVAADPFASSYPVALAALTSMYSTTSGIPSILPSTSPVTTATSSISAPHDDSGISRGTIGGIVGGILGVLALIGVGIFLLQQRRAGCTGSASMVSSSHQGRILGPAETHDTGARYEAPGRMSRMPMQQNLAEVYAVHTPQHY
jgi:hypothetical protein